MRGGREEEDHLSPGHPCHLATAPTCWSEAPVDDWIESYFAFCGPSQWHALASKNKIFCDKSHPYHGWIFCPDFLIMPGPS